MPKNIFEDIKPITREPRPTPLPLAQVPQQPRPQLPRELPFEPVEPKHSPRYALWYIAAALVIAFLFSLSFLFEHATVTVTPKSVPVAFDTTDSFTAQKDSVADDTIIYTVMTLSDDQSIKLPSTDSKNQSIAATGRVILYNAYTTAPYKLVKSTRLQTPDGRIYRIDAAATIPGYVKSAGSVIPGSVEVSVTAAEAGAASNLDTSDFSVPGLAGTAQATKIYGRTKSAISGGITGLVYSVSQDAASAALGTLQDKLKASLIAKAKVQVPDGYVFFDGATTFATDDSVQAPYSTTPDVPLALHGTMSAYLIQEASLVHAIAEKAVSQYNNEDVTIPGLGALSLVPSEVLTPESDTSFTFTFSGSADIVWTVKPEDITTLLVGKKKSDFETLLAGVTGVDRAEVVLKPFWKRSFPEDPKRVTVSIVPPSQ